MSEFFLELFSEEIPSGLQRNARVEILRLFNESFNKNDIKFKNGYSYSTPNRLVFFFDGLQEKIEQKHTTIKGPKIEAPPIALEGFLKSNNLNRGDIFEKNTEKGKFYFAKIKPKIIFVKQELSKIIPNILDKYSWRKSMKWADYNLVWGRPLKSILALFDGELIKFDFHHLQSSNTTYADGVMQNDEKVVKDFKSYLNLLKSRDIILDHNVRKKIIEKKNTKNLSIQKL